MNHAATVSQYETPETVRVDEQASLYYETDFVPGSVSVNPVELFAALLKTRLDGGAVLEVGSGGTEAARYLAGQGNYLVDCLNISELENSCNDENTYSFCPWTRVYEGHFEAMPFENGVYDAVWSQNVMLHCGDREAVFQEVDRVLKSGGYFVFTDVMATSECPEVVQENILGQIRPDQMGSVERYIYYAEKMGWSVVDIDLKPQQAASHYRSASNEISARSDKNRKYTSGKTTLAENPLLHCDEAAWNNHITWGMLVFQKP